MDPRLTRVLMLLGAVAIYFASDYAVASTTADSIRVLAGVLGGWAVFRRPGDVG